jgi:hypothetical protein
VLRCLFVGCLLFGLENQAIKQNKKIKMKIMNCSERRRLSRSKNTGKSKKDAEQRGHAGIGRRDRANIITASNND